MEAFDDLTILFLHRLLCRRIDELTRSSRRCEAYIDRGIDRYEKLAVLEAETNTLSDLRERLVHEIALRNLLKGFTL